MKNRLTLVALVFLIGLAGLLAWVLWPTFQRGTNVVQGNETANGLEPRVKTNQQNGPANSEPLSGNQPPTNQPPTNTPDPKVNEEPKHPPDETPKAKVQAVPVAKPLLAWNLGQSDLERVSQDPKATEQERTEAAARLVLDFWKWPGRDVQKLGGFVFDQNNYPELKGFTTPAGAQNLVNVRLEGEPPNVCIDRLIFLQKGPSRIDLVVRVMASREWAQRYFLGWVVGGARSAPFMGKLGSERGINVGDVCEGDAQDSLQDKGRLQFVRHNVAINLKLRLTKYDETPTSMNVVDLARKIDRDIQSQSHDASTWEDLNDFRPVIDQFYFDPREVVKGEEDPRVEIVLATHHPEGKAITIFSKSEEGGRVAILPKLEAPKFARLILQKYVEGRPYKAWLLAYDDSLLFSLAEASATVKLSGE